MTDWEPTSAQKDKIVITVKPCPSGQLVNHVAICILWGPVINITYIQSIPGSNQGRIFNNFQIDKDDIIDWQMEIHSQKKNLGKKIISITLYM